MKKYILALMLVIGLSGNSQADTVSHFGDGIGSDIPSLLNQVGIGSGNSASETIAEIYSIPGNSNTTDLTFTFVRDTGSFLFNFGFFDINNVTANPILDKENWAIQALTNATLVFDDRFVNPGATSIHTVTQGTNFGFFLIPNNTLSTFLSSPDDFYPPQTSNNELRAPHFSVSNADPGEFDQMLSFIGNDITLFTFEDLSRIGNSDIDFTDLAFTINAELEPVPIPSAIFLFVSGLAGLIGFRVNKSLYST